MFKGLRNKFLFVYMGTVVLLIFLFCGVIFTFTYQNIERNSNEILERGFNMRQRPMGEIRPPAAELPPQGRGIRSDFAPMFSVEIDGSGKITRVDSFFEMEDSFYEELTQSVLSQSKKMGKVKADDAIFKYKVTYGRVVFLDVSQDEQMLRNMLYIFLWIAIPMLVFIFLISLYFANRSIKPIEISYNKQKEFIADASHELKTPLATIATNIDVLFEGANGEQTKWLTYIKSETERMANLTGSLLYLAKMDYKDANDLKSIFNFSDLINDYLMPFEALFYENKIKTDINILPDVKINGNSEQIRRLVGILIDNAIKYTNGRIRISLDATAGSAKLTVYNTGAGIVKDDLEKVWNRFFRGDKSREYSGGFGLGLPIAKAIADSHKGSITAESNVNEWTRFTVKIPLA